MGATAEVAVKAADVAGAVATAVEVVEPAVLAVEMGAQAARAET